MKYLILAIAFFSVIDIGVAVYIHQSDKKRARENGKSNKPE